MQELTPMTQIQTFDAIQRLHTSIGCLTENLEVMKRDYYYRRLKEIVEDNYHLGRVQRVFQIFGGTVNENYALEMELEGKRTLWFLRQYVAEKEEKEILYEHELLRHIRKNGFLLNSLPQENKYGKTYFRESVAGTDHYFAVSEFLKGKDTYQWEKNEVTPEACTSAAGTIASFHSSACDFNPPDDWGSNEPVIREQLSYYGQNIRNHTKIIASNPDNALFAQYLQSKAEYLEEVIARLQKIFSYDNRFPKTVIHSDLHPGNFKYEGEEVVAMFDFDWPKKDVRLYETAISAMFFSSSWRSENNGEINLRLMKLFIQTYDHTLKTLGKGISPMNETELTYFPEMMMIGSLYVVHFCMEKSSRAKDINIFEYFYYTMHQIRCVEWIDQHKEEMRELCLSHGEEAGV